MLRLARIFGSPRAALEASEGELAARGKLSAEQAAGVSAVAASLKAAQDRIQGWGRSGIELLAAGDPVYPSQLFDLRAPPPLLYLLGTLAAGDERAVAVVGTREPSPEGERLARAIARGLAQRGYTVVSGLARGIDTAGHRGALEAERGRTIAVLGCGLFRIYPRENVALSAKIAERGCLMAEVPPETEVGRRLLLARDRIQAALSRAVIVVQAHGECGSLVTARQAARCRRRVFGVPWPEAPFRNGWRNLERLGARPLDTQTDLDELSAEIDAPLPPAPQTLLL